MAAERLWAWRRLAVGGGRLCSLLVGLVEAGVIESPPMYSDKFLWCDCEVDGLWIVLGDRGSWDPNENCGRGSRVLVLGNSFEAPFSSKVLAGRLPVAREKDAGADDGNVGDGRLTGNLNSGKGRGPGEFSRGEGPSERPGLAWGRWSTIGDAEMEVIIPAPPRGQVTIVGLKRFHQDS